MRAIVRIVTVLQHQWTPMLQYTSSMIRTIVALTAILAVPTFPADIYKGAQVQEVYRIRLDRGDLLLETIQDAIRTNNIQDGAVLTAVGSLQEAIDELRELARGVHRAILSEEGLAPALRSLAARAATPPLPSIGSRPTLDRRRSLG